MMTADAPARPANPGVTQADRPATVSVSPAASADGDRESPRRRETMRVQRFPENPIIRPHMDGRMGDNINGPSLIRVPNWVERPLGPAIYREDGRTYLLYSVAGEYGIAIAELLDA